MSTPGGVQGVQIISSHRTVELLGGQRTRDVYEVGAVTQPSNVFFQFRVPVALVDPGSIHATAAAISVQLEDLFTFPNVVGLSYVQDVDNANQLQDLMEIYVQSDNGEASDFLRWPLESVDARVLGQPIADLAAKLNAIVV